MQVCELCRLYPEVVSTEDKFIFCQNISLMCQYSADSLELDETVGIINGYGQVLISQFISESIICIFHIYNYC